MSKEPQTPSDLRESIYRVMRLSLTDGHGYTDDELDTLVGAGDFEKPFHALIAEEVLKARVAELKLLDNVLPVKEPELMAFRGNEDEGVAHVRGMMFAFAEVEEHQQFRLAVLHSGSDHIPDTGKMVVKDGDV